MTTPPASQPATPPARYHRTAPAWRRPGLARALQRSFGAALAVTALSAAAANECRYQVEYGSPPQVHRQTLSVGDVDKTVLPRVAVVRNQGLHDLRLRFEGAAPRQLAQGQSEPGSGRFAAPVALRSVECLAMRSKGGP